MAREYTSRKDMDERGFEKLGEGGFDQGMPGDAERVARPPGAHDRGGEAAGSLEAESERTRVYEDITEDPAYRKMEQEITKRVNRDEAVQVAMQKDRTSRSEGYGVVWNRAALRERFNGLNQFITSYPEKARAYIERWDAYVQQRPEVADLVNSQWKEWCDTHPGASAMSEYRSLARVAAQRKRRSAAA